MVKGRGTDTERDAHKVVHLLLPMHGPGDNRRGERHRDPCGLLADPGLATGGKGGALSSRPTQEERRGQGEDR